MPKYQKIILSATLSLYLIWGFILFFFQRQLTYFPNKSDFYTCPAFSDAEKITQGNTRMYLIKKDSEKLVVFYHGNAVSACSTGYIRDVIDSSGASVLVPEYSGYAGDGNKPSKDAILKNVYEVTEYLKKHKYASIVVVGESLWTWVASYHASLIKPEKLALISPFSSMKDVARTRFWMYPMIPVSENYDSVQYLKEYTGSLLIIHGDSDDVVPPALSQKLLDAVPSNNKKRISIPWWEHEYIWSAPWVRDMVRMFIK